jgi:hypothetical protein
MAYPTVNQTRQVIVARLDQSVNADGFGSAADISSFKSGGRAWYGNGVAEALGLGGKDHRSKRRVAEVKKVMIVAREKGQLESFSPRSSWKNCKTSACVHGPREALYEA